MGIYAGLGMTIASAFPALIGLKDVEVLGLHSAKMTSATNAQVFGRKNAALVSSTEKTEVLSRTGAVDVVAPRIQVGSFEGGAPQLPTKKVQVEALDHVNVQTDKTDYTLPKGSISIAAEAELEARSKKTLGLASQEKITATVEAGKTFLDLDKAKKEATLAAHDACLALGTGSSKLSHGDAYVELENGSVAEIGLRGESLVEVTKAAVRVTGKKIHLL